MTRGRKIRHVCSVLNFHQLSLASFGWRTKRPVNAVNQIHRILAIPAKKTKLALSSTSRVKKCSVSLMLLIQLSATVSGIVPCILPFRRIASVRTDRTPDEWPSSFNQMLVCWSTVKAAGNVVYHCGRKRHQYCGDGWQSGARAPAPELFPSTMVDNVACGLYRRPAH